jgi:hypothetical protein
MKMNSNGRSAKSHSVNDPAPGGLIKPAGELQIFYQHDAWAPSLSQLDSRSGARRVAPSGPRGKIECLRQPRTADPGPGPRHGREVREASHDLATVRQGSKTTVNPREDWDLFRNTGVADLDRRERLAERSAMVAEPDCRFRNSGGTKKRIEHLDEFEVNSRYGLPHCGHASGIGRTESEKSQLG